MGSKRILLAISNPLYREATAEVLARIQGTALVGKVGTGWEVVKLAAQLKPDIVILDLRLPGLDGFEATRAIKQQGTQTAVILLLDNDIHEYINAVIQSGAQAYLIKSQIAEELPALLSKLKQQTLEERQVS